MEIKIIGSLSEILEMGVGRYAHISNPTKWIQIDEKDGFSVFGFVSGPNPTSITGQNWNMVKIWKTFGGVVGALKKYSEKGEWGMGHWNS